MDFYVLAFLSETWYHKNKAICTEMHNYAVHREMRCCIKRKKQPLFAMYKRIQEEEKMKRKFMALALAAAMTVSMTSAVFAADEIKSADDLTGKKIGVQLGTTGDTIATDIKDATVERYNKGNDAVMALKQGKIDCVVIDSEPAKKFVDKNDDLKLIDNVFDKEEYAICISKDNTDLTKEFNDALKELKDDGTLDSIRDNYIGDDAGKTPYETPKDADHSKGTLTMATNATFQPYEYYDGDNIVGIDVISHRQSVISLDTI